MRKEQFPLFALSTLILNVAGCGNSEPGPSGSGGSTGLISASGGAVSTVTGGVAATGGTTQAADTGGATGKVTTTASGGNEATGGMKATGGATSTPATGGTFTGVGGSGVGGKSVNASGGASATGGAGATNTGGRTSALGGAATGGSPVAGGTPATGGTATGSVTGGRTGTGGATVATGGTTSTGPCTVTASKTANVTVTGSGPHKVVVESNSDSQISCGTIYRPSDLGGTEKYPIYVWGEGACSRSGTANSAAMGEIASHGYFVIADGPPSGGNCPSISMPSTAADLTNMGKPLLGYIAWAIAENEKPCSAYYHSIDTTKIASNGFSCGGLMSAGTSADPRMTTWGINSSGLTSPDQNFYKAVHTPVLIVLGGTSDIAYTNGETDYTNISARGVPIMLFSKNIGHGGDLGSARGGDFAKIDLAWLNWWLKGDLTATGKGLLVGSSCSYCTNSAWEVKSANLP